MTHSIRAKFEDIRILDAATINVDGLSYVPIGSAFPFPAKLMKISNNSNQDILASFSGVQYNIVTGFNPGKMFIPANGFTLYDISINQAEGGISAGKIVFIRKAVPAAAAVGTIYLEIMYAG